MPDDFRDLIGKRTSIRIAEHQTVRSGPCRGEHRLERERQVVAELAEGPRDAAALTAAIYPGVSGNVAELARRSVLAQLVKLGGEGRVRRTGSAEDGSFELT